MQKQLKLERIEKMGHIHDLESKVEIILLEQGIHLGISF